MNAIVSRLNPIRLLPNIVLQTCLKMVSTTEGSTNTVDKNNEHGQLRVKRISEHAYLPTRGSKFAAGYDLYSAYDCVVPARGKSLVIY